MSGWDQHNDNDRDQWEHPPIALIILTGITVIIIAFFMLGRVL